MSVYHDDDHKLVQLFDEFVSIWQPWWFVTLSYNLPKINASTLITTFIGFQNQPPHINIHLVPINLEMEWPHPLNK
jgi:hypothetical protein